MIKFIFGILLFCSFNLYARSDLNSRRNNLFTVNGSTANVDAEFRIVNSSPTICNQHFYLADSNGILIRSSSPITANALYDGQDIPYLNQNSAAKMALIQGACVYVADASASGGEHLAGPQDQAGACGGAQGDAPFPPEDLQGGVRPSGRAEQAQARRCLDAHAQERQRPAL